VSVGAVIAIGVRAATVAGVALSALTYWITQRRVRPIVTCQEHQKRHIRHEATRGYWVASVYLTNESTTTAFNVRFGIDMAGRHISWKYDREDQTASRLNVLRPSGRHPDQDGVIDVFIDDRMLWHISHPLGGDGDADDGRIYWAYYQGPAGDWWYTYNPFDRTTDFTIKRVRSRRFGPISRGKGSVPLVGAAICCAVSLTMRAPRCDRGRESWLLTNSSRTMPPFSPDLTVGPESRLCCKAQILDAAAGPGRALSRRKPGFPVAGFVITGLSACQPADRRSLGRDATPQEEGRSPGPLTSTGCELPSCKSR
jgi:hypothetical protein